MKTFTRPEAKKEAGEVYIIHLFRCKYFLFLILMDLHKESRECSEIASNIILTENRQTETFCNDSWGKKKCHIFQVEQKIRMRKPSTSEKPGVLSCDCSLLWDLVASPKQFELQCIYVKSSNHTSLA